MITSRMPNARLTGPAPWPAMNGITGPTTVPLQFEVTTVTKHG